MLVCAYAGGLGPMKRALMMLIVGTILSGIAAAYAASQPLAAEAAATRAR